MEITKNIGWTSYTTKETSVKASLAWFVKLIDPFLDLVLFSDSVKRIIVASIIFPSSLKKNVLEKKYFSKAEKTIIIRCYFDYDTFLNSTEAECKKILLHGFVDELRNIKNIRGMKNVNFDIEKFNQKIDEFLSKVETQFLD